MTALKLHNKTAYLSYSTNVHPAETAQALDAVLTDHVAPISRKAFGDGVAAVNLRLGMAQTDELLGHPVLGSTSTLSDEQLSAPPASACEAFIARLDALKLDVVSINAFPIRDFHAPRVKEQVYSPPWSDGGRSLYSYKIAKVLTHFMARPSVNRTVANISVPTGVFKGLYPDSLEVHEQCAHWMTECVRELRRLERLTGRTVQLGLEPEPSTTGETCAEFIKYFEVILAVAREKFPTQLGITRAQSDDIIRRFVTINLDLCHQAVEYEDPVADLKLLRAAGITLGGIHISAALKLLEPAQNTEAFAHLKALDEPRYLHQVIARLRDNQLVKFHDLPDLWNPKRLGNRTLADFAELRCHFHVPLFAELQGPLQTTRDAVAPAVHYALKEGLTNNFVCETYTWHVLSALAQQSNAGATTVIGADGKPDISAGIVRELQWAQEMLTKA